MSTGSRLNNGHYDSLSVVLEQILSRRILSIDGLSQIGLVCDSSPKRRDTGFMVINPFFSSKKKLLISPVISLLCLYVDTQVFVLR